MNMNKLTQYRSNDASIKMWKDHIRVLEEYENIIDLSRELKEAYTEVERLEKEQESIKDIVRNINNERYKTMFFMFYIKGFSKRDIAEYLGINERWLYRLWDRAEKEVNAYEQ